MARFAACLAFSIVLIASAHSDCRAAPRIVSANGHFVIDGGDGRQLRDTALKGVVLKTRDNSGSIVEVRIDAIEPSSRLGVELYRLSVRDAGVRGGWRPYCAKGQDGRRRGFPIPVAATSIEEPAFTLVCTAGAQGKCVMRGYRPWAVTADGVSLERLFRACVRMMRADYCGDGTSFTRAGIRITSWDRAGIRQEPVVTPPFEAAWGVDGAVCLSRLRAPDIASIDRLLAHCPTMAERIRGDCRSISSAAGSGAVLWNAVPDSPIADGRRPRARLP